MAGPGLEELFFERVEHRIVEGVSVPVARAEDVIAMNILAGRPKDIASRPLESLNSQGSSKL